MIILNDKELKQNFITSETRLVKIQSDLTLEELFTKALNGEDLTSLATIKVIKGFKAGSCSIKTIPLRTKYLKNITDVGEFKHFRDDGEFSPSAWAWEPGERETAIQNECEHLIVDDITRRPEIAKAYEAQVFHQNIGAAFDELTEDTVDLENTLISELADALGIMPHLIHEDLPLEEKKRLSNLGKDLYFPRALMPYSEYNGLPSLEEIRYYDSLPSPVKKKIMDSHNFMSLVGNPAYTLALTKSKYNGMPINFSAHDFESSPFYEASDSVVTTTEISSYEQPSVFTNKESEILEKATTLFTERYRRAPMVIKEMVKSIPVDVLNNLSTDEAAAFLVDNFNQQSLAKVARYKNANLLFLTNYLNWNECKDSHIPIFGTNKTFSEMRCDATGSGSKVMLFLDYYKQHKSTITDSELATLLESLPTLQPADYEKTPTELIKFIGNRIGYRDKEAYERDYHYSFDNNVLAIQGADIVVTKGPYKMYMLPPDDIRNFTVGYDTYCCQHKNGAGESCTYKLTSDPFAGVCVIEKNGKVRAQGFIWTDEKMSTLVFDNVEFAEASGPTERERVQEYLSMFSLFAENLPYENVHIGTGYNENMRGVGTKINRSEFATLPVTIDNRHCYSDYHDSNARVIKRNGEVLIPTDNKTFVTRDSSLLRDQTHAAVWEILKPENAWILNLRLPYGEKLEILQKKNIINTLSDGEQLRLIRIYPDIVDFIEHPSDEVQREVIRLDKSLVSKIHNCNESIINDILLEENPREINNPERHFTEEQQIRIYTAHPDYLRQATYFNHNVLLALAGVNAYSVLNAPMEYITRDIKLRAITQNPKIISTFGAKQYLGRRTIYRYERELLERALTEDMSVLRIIGPTSEIPEDIQVRAITQDASLVNSLYEPCTEAIRIAIEHNPLLIRNFQYKHPDLALRAVELNPRVINIITTPTPEMLDLIPDVNIITVPRFKQLYLDRQLAMQTNLSEQDNIER